MTVTPDDPAAPLDVIVIGGGQAGLAAGYHLQRSGLTFRILDANTSTGDSWRTRYDTLMLFTPAKRNALPGLPFPGDPEHYPTKDEVADYLNAYVQAFHLPVEHASPVLQVQTTPAGFTVTTLQTHWTARAVVVATGPFQTPHTPAFARTLAPDVVQLHSSAYRRPTDLPPGRVVVVGSGNSGAQIAQELSRTHMVTVAQGRPQPALPQRLLGRDIFDVLSTLGLLDVSAASPLGRALQRRDPVIGTNLKRLSRAGQLQLASRIVDTAGQALMTQNGQRLETEGVVWATGFRPNYRWLDVGVLDEHGFPIHDGGVTRVPGVFFLGLPWQRTRSSALLGGVGQDAQRLVQGHLA
ncbi:flavin-containing monooxygenase [Deinococcus multiflagellatus]|uniref:Flavin-containing monooxygenase n=1 Tax=Deinococcus multiflagellatus TaxID=1656887 RepID=A0ABW1ZQD1_9DEIO|nr:NAD(P)/FAD-dependent oxidoreductase [Deinococcus multiflagellatus]MBZ9715401.1 NAD(P)/FAD-dependent oxidoreductase [Deinococcus multiflagellatus]